MKKFLLIAATTLLSGCATTSSSNDKDILQKEINAKLLRIEDSNRKNECILRLLDAKTTCDLLHRVDPPGMSTDKKIQQCISTKGFPNGINKCGN